MIIIGFNLTPEQFSRENKIYKNKIYAFSLLGIQLNKTQLNIINALNNSKIKY